MAVFGLKLSNDDKFTFDIGPCKTNNQFYHYLGLLFIGQESDYFCTFFFLFLSLMLRNESSGEVEGVQTSKNTLHCKKAVVVAAGCWSGSLMHDLIKNSEIELDLPVKPRKVRTLGESLSFLKFELLLFLAINTLLGFFEFETLKGGQYEGIKKFFSHIFFFLLLDSSMILF